MIFSFTKDETEHDIFYPLKMKSNMIFSFMKDETEHDIFIH